MNMLRPLNGNWILRSLEWKLSESGVECAAGPLCMHLLPFALWQDTVWPGTVTPSMGGDHCQKSVFCNSAYVSVLCYSLSEIGCMSSVRGGMCLCERGYMFCERAYVFSL